MPKEGLCDGISLTVLPSKMFHTEGTMVACGVVPYMKKCSTCERFVGVPDFRDIMQFCEDQTV
jgi:hypothetical protein